MPKAPRAIEGQLDACDASRSVQKVVGISCEAIADMRRRLRPARPHVDERRAYKRRVRNYRRERRTCALTPLTLRRQLAKSSVTVYFSANLTLSAPA